MPYILAAFASLVSIAALLKYSRRRTPPLPPGPKPLPLVGNVLDIPKKIDPEAFDKLTKRYGDIVHLDVLGQHMMIIGSYEVAVDLLDKRSANYSDRAPSAMAELTGASWILFLFPYGHAWRQRRKQFHQFFGPGAFPQYRAIQEKHTRRLLKDILATPEDVFSHIRFGFSATIMQIVYGIEVTDPDDPYVALEEETLRVFQEAFVPGKYLVEIFPILRHIPSWFPGARFRKEAEEWRKVFTSVRDSPFDATIQRMQNGENVKSMVTEIAKDITTPEDELVARDVTGVTYASGADTIASTLHIFILAMSTHPDVQRKAHAELEDVVGSGRLPRSSDRESLPYFQATILECMRWKPVLQIIFPHRSMEDDEYRGYHIPAGTVILPNTWSMVHDARYYPEPEKFMPERFLKDGKLNKDVLDPRLFIFGYGRRSCPGSDFAQGSLFLTMASILHVFDIGPQLDHLGNPIIPPGNMKVGFLSYPEPFQCTLKPKSKSAEALIVSEAEGV